MDISVFKWEMNASINVCLNVISISTNDVINVINHSFITTNCDGIDCQILKYFHNYHVFCSFCSNCPGPHGRTVFEWMS